MAKRNIDRLGLGKRARFSVGVGGIRTKAGVAHQTAVRHARQHAGLPMAVRPGEIPGIDLPARRGIQDARPIALETSVAQALQQALVPKGWPRGEAGVVLRPGPPPTPPTPR